jgi:hypothetical protein
MKDDLLVHHFRNISKTPQGEFYDLPYGGACILSREFAPNKFSFWMYIVSHKAIYYGEEFAETLKRNLADIPEPYGTIDFDGDRGDDLMHTIVSFMLRKTSREDSFESKQVYSTLSLLSISHGYPCDQRDFSWLLDKLKIEYPGEAKNES